MREETGKIRVVMIEVSAIIREGLTQILTSAFDEMDVVSFSDLKELDRYENKREVALIILNPGMISGCTNNVVHLLEKFPSAKTIGIITHCSDREQVSFFDDVIYMNDDCETLCRVIKNNLSVRPQNSAFNKKLSSRELDVLKLLIKGHSNKQIADDLFISVHTVVTHRKNIIQKLGIKSTAGLTIYGVIHNIINIEDYLDQVQ